MDKNKLKELLRLQIKPFWSHMDALGHINNSIYFTYCEQARIAWLEKIGFGDALSGKSKTGPVIINASCTYHKAVIYPCDLTVILYSDIPGRSSLMTYYEITDGKILYTTGSSKIVWVDYEREKSVQLPEKIKDLLI